MEYMRAIVCRYVAILAAACGLVLVGISGEAEAFQDCTCGGNGDRPCYITDGHCHFIGGKTGGLLGLGICDRGLKSHRTEECLVPFIALNTCGCLQTLFGKCVIPKLCAEEICLESEFKWTCESDDRKSGNAPGDLTSFRGSWGSWALKQQRELAVGEPINQIMHLAAHNAYNNQGDRYIEPTNQSNSITSLLDAGVRVLMLDAVTYLSLGLPGVPDVLQTVKLCHALDPGVSLPVPLCDPRSRLFVHGIREIADWVKRNRGEVVILEIEDIDVDGDSQAENDLVGAIDKYLGNWVLRKSEKPEGRWPTLEEMRQMGRRVIVLVQEHQDSTLLFDGAWGGAHKYGFGGSKAKFFSPYPDCNGYSQNDEKFSEVAEDRSFVSWVPGESVGRICKDTFEVPPIPPPFEVSFPTPDPEAFWCRDLADLARCNINIIGLDFILDDSQMNFDGSKQDRLDHAVWSWEPGDWGQGGPVAVFTREGRIRSVQPGEQYVAACGRPRSGDPADWVDPVGEEWLLTETAGGWVDGFKGCQLNATIDDPWDFGVPRNGYQAEKLRELLEALNVDEVFVNYEDLQADGTWAAFSNQSSDLSLENWVVSEGEKLVLGFRQPLIGVGAPCVLENGLARCPSTPREFEHTYGDDSDVPIPIVVNHWSGGNFKNPTHCVVIDWGDGTVERFGPDPAECPSQRVVNARIFALVGNHPPSVELPSTYDIDLGEELEIRETLADPGFLDTHDGQVLWGDGNVDFNRVLSANVSFPCGFECTPGFPPNCVLKSCELDESILSAAHTYEACGEYDLEALVEDDDGGVGHEHVTVEVADTPSLQCPPNQHRIMSGDGPYAVELGLPVASDACAGDPTVTASIELDNPVTGSAELPLGLHAIEWVARRYSRETTCTQTVVLSGQVCDVNADATVDRIDVAAIQGAAGEATTSATDPRQSDGLGEIDALDARACVSYCTYAQCQPEGSIPATVPVTSASEEAPPPAPALIPLGLSATALVVVIGGPGVDVELFVTGLGDGAAPSLGVFDIDLYFDETRLEVVEVSLATALGDLDPATNESSIVSSVGPGLARLSVASLLDSGVLHAQQPSGFTLAVVRFEGIGEGAASASVTSALLGDAEALELTVGEFPGVVITVVPEPSGLLAALAAVSALFALSVLRTRPKSPTTPKARGTWHHCWSANSRVKGHHFRHLREIHHRLVSEARR